MKKQPAISKPKRTVKRKPRLPKVKPHSEELFPEVQPKPDGQPAPNSQTETNEKIESKSEPETESVPGPESQSKPYTHEDWQKEVAKHVPPGRPIPDWLAAKAP